MDEKRLTRLLSIAKACLLAALVYVGAEVATNALHLSPRIDPKTARGELAALHTQGAVPEACLRPDYAIIVERDLFAGPASANHAKTSSPPPPVIDSITTAEELALRLVGTIAGGPLASRAVIQDTNTNSSGSYRIGDAVASATVEAIQRDAVVLRYQGRPLVLKLSPGKPESKGQRTEERRPQKEIAGQTVNGSSQSPSAVAAPTSESSRMEYVAEVFRKATIEPYIRESRSEGLKITGLDKIPMAELFGLKDGDVIQSVNGQSLTSKQKAFQILMKAKTQPKMSIRLLRDGRSKDLSFDL